MRASDVRVVLDTNVLLSGLASESSASQRIVDGLQRRSAVLLLSREVLAEYRSILLHPAIAARFSNLIELRVARALTRLTFLADVYKEVHVRFTFPRDPRDAKFIELSIAGQATHLVTLDPDLLDLPTSRSDAGKRFRQRLPNIRVLKPAEFLTQCAELFDVS